MTIKHGLPPHAARVLDTLSRLGGETALSNAELAKLTGYSVAWVKHALMLLEDASLITVQRRRRNRHHGDPTGRTLRLGGGAA